MENGHKIAKLLHELRPLMEKEMEEKFGEVLALQALSTLEDLYEAELLEDYK
jgi:hypothetical protein